MRKYHEIRLSDRNITTKELHGEEVVQAGRYLIAKTLLERNAASIDPLSPQNPLIFSAGPFAGTAWSNANRISVGCKSPLTGGVKEANGGGTFAYALGQVNTSGLTLLDVSPDWVVIHLTKSGEIEFDDATPYMGKGNIETADMLIEKYGKRVALAICGPVGEYQGLLAGVSFTDKDLRPTRLAARGGVGAVMGSKRVKSIVVDMDKMPTFEEPKKVTAGVRKYAKMIQEDEVVQNGYRPLGTMAMADFQNQFGGLPVRNFSAGRLADTGAGEEFKMGAAYIGPLNTSRGGEQSHACMPGCLIQCSNIYKDADGNEVTSPIEYETLGLLGTNCGLTDPDDLARINAIANDLGVDTIETGATLGVLMEAGVGEFGDVEFMAEALDEIRQGTENGRIWAQGTAFAGAHYEAPRIPVIKGQALGAYDPRVVEGTGLGMMTTAQGADHTVGNLPRLDTSDMDLDEILAQSLVVQTKVAAADSLGLCAFGQSVTNTNTDFLAETLNAAHGTNLDAGFFDALGGEALRLEREFNEKAGFTDKDDELPTFFYEEELPPSGRVARFHGADVHGIYEGLPS